MLDVRPEPRPSELPGPRGAGATAALPGRRDCSGFTGKPRRMCCKTTFIYKGQRGAAGKPRPSDRLTCDDAEGRRAEPAAAPPLASPQFHVPEPRPLPWLYRCFPDSGGEAGPRHPCANSECLSHTGATRLPEPLEASERAVIALVGLQSRPGPEASGLPRALLAPEAQLGHTVPGQLRPVGPPLPSAGTKTPGLRPSMVLARSAGR